MEEKNSFQTDEFTIKQERERESERMCEAGADKNVVVVIFSNGT